MGITIQDPPRVRKMDTFIVFYLFVLYSVTCLNLSLPSDCVFYVTMNIYLCFYFDTARDVDMVLLLFVVIYHFNYTSSHAHIYAHTHKHT